MNQVLGSLDLEKHHGKTFVGRVERGLDFLGYHFSPRGLSVADATLVKFVERAARLYEQEAGEARRLPPARDVRSMLAQVGPGSESSPSLASSRSLASIKVGVTDRWTVIDVQGGRHDGVLSELTVGYT